jgi:hypothetical protein
VRSQFTTWIFVLSLCTFLGFAPNASAQRQSTPSPPPVRGDPSLPPITNADDAQERLTTEMAKKAAKERAAALKSDTDKLLKLSVELKQSVDKSDENVLSLDVIKKAEEIEKLARSVKEKMKGPN